MDKKLKIIITIFMILFSISNIAVSQILDYNARLDVFSSVVQLTVDKADGAENGSGVIVNADGIILTNAHVIEGAIDILVSTFTDFNTDPVPLYKAEVLHENVDLDVAVLKITSFDRGEPLPSSLNLPVMDQWTETAQVSEIINLFGYPDGSFATLTEGTIASLQTRSNDAYYQSDATVSDGASGGIIINSAREMVGLVYASTGTMQLAEIVPIKTIYEAFPEAAQYLPPAVNNLPLVSANENCASARFQGLTVGERFVVPYGDSGTWLRSAPDWRRNNVIETIPEGSGGIILEGPRCSPAQKGNLTGWRVQSDSGNTGWISEGYVFNMIPWISRPEDVNTWRHTLPPGFACGNSYGPNFRSDIPGERFVVPPGDGPTTIYSRPHSGNRLGQIPEEQGGIILEGPVCAQGGSGRLISWRIRTDNGMEGWVSEGYNSSRVPWIAREY